VNDCTARSHTARNCSRNALLLRCWKSCSTRGYSLQHETTAGGAHPVMIHRIDDYFMITVPSRRTINPITKTNWEGVAWSRT
jgi:hypothetical protein